MRVRVAGTWKHPKSGIHWFRMAVPKRNRTVVGQREIKESLRTRSEPEARLKHAAKLVEVTSFFARLDGEVEVGVEEEAQRVCRRGFDTLARRNLSHHRDGVTTLVDAENNVLIGMPTLLAFRVRCSWGEDHRIRAELHLLGDSHEEPMPATVPTGITEAGRQDEVVERIHALEGRFVPSLDHAENEISVLCGIPKTEGLVYREIAAGLLLSRGRLGPLVRCATQRIARLRRTTARAA